MQSVSNGLARTMVAVAGTMLCGSVLMFAALGPGVAQAHAAPVAYHQTAVR
jgi:threonine/homoserine/homoserine lactone efflux protein